MFFPTAHAPLVAESATELARLIEQERLLASALAGPLTGLPDPSAPLSWQAVLDLGCGPGGWVLDTAFAYPDLEVAGIDSSPSLIAYARARARTQHLCNASFQVMDLTPPLDFSAATFDLVHAQLLSAMLPQHAWPPLLTECRRLLKPGGCLLLTEMRELNVRASPAFHYLGALVMEHLGSPQQWASGMARFPGLLRETGYRQVQTVSSVLDVSRGTQLWYPWVQNVLVLLLQVLPLIHSLSQEALEQLYQQVVVELQAETFQGMCIFEHYSGRICS